MSTVSRTEGNRARPAKDEAPKPSRPRSSAQQGKPRGGPRKRPRSAPDWSLRDRFYSSGPKGWKPGMVRLYPHPGMRRRVYVDFICYSRHWYVDVRPEHNSVWDGEKWCHFADDPESLDPPFRRHDARLSTFDRAVRWTRRILREAFPDDAWEVVWHDGEGAERHVLAEDAAEKEAIRPCPTCAAPVGEHTPEDVADCAAEDALEAPPLVRAAMRRIAKQKADEARGLQAAGAVDVVAVRVLVDPGRGPISGTVGEEVVVAPDMHPSRVDDVATARALIVERGGATVHLAQVARERGVAVLLVEDATARYPFGTIVTIDFARGTCRVDVPAAAG